MQVIRRCQMKDKKDLFKEPVTEKVVCAAGEKGRARGRAPYGGEGEAPPQPPLTAAAHRSH